MAILDLSSVTRSLVKLLYENINQTWYSFDEAPEILVTPEPPDKLGSAENTISVFLYHVSEDPHYKNFEGPGVGGRNVARTPMALCLYYILTPHQASAEPPEDNYYAQQSLMGYALKTMHDYPIVTKDTKVGLVSILTGDMAETGNSLQIILRPVSPEDALAFWGSEDVQTARLSAYYEVRVIMLEPEEPETMVAPVLSLGTYLYQLGTPHLEKTTSELPFTLPPSAGGSSQLVELTPARASGNDGENPPHNRIVLNGYNLAKGKSRQLWLRSAEFPEAVDGRLPIDLSLTDNVTEGWALSVADDKLILDVGSTLHYLDAAGDPAETPLLPGIYTAFLRVRMGDRMAGSTLVPITNDSNEVPLIIIPRIASAEVAGGKIDVTIEPTFLLNTAGLDVRLYVDGEAYIKDAETGTATDGEFEILDTETLRFNPRFIETENGEHPIRLIINGAESAPYWIVTTAP